MPIKKLNVSEIIENKRKDKKFDLEYKANKCESDIIDQIIKKRKELGYTQSELAEKLEMKQQNISRIEKRKISPTLETICRILYVLNLEIEIK